MNTTTREKNLKELVLGKCWDYINDNFHKFNEANKIKVSLALIQKSMPTEMIGQFQVTHMPTILVGEKPLEFNIGSLNLTQDTRYPSEAVPLN